MKTLAFLFLLMATAFGRLGETVAECDARYGKPTLSREDYRWYEKTGISIHARFRGGKACEIGFSAVASWKNLRGALTEGQISGILELLAVGGPWKEVAVVGKEAVDSMFQKTLVRGDGQVEAVWDYPTGHLTLTTRQELKIQQLQRHADAIEKKLKEQKSVEGL